MSVHLANGSLPETAFLLCACRFGAELMTMGRSFKIVYADMASLPGLGCHADGQRVEVGLIGCVAVKARVRPAAVVEVKIPAD